MSAQSDDLDLLAAELAFGLLDGDARAAAEQRRAEDPDFATAVAQWRDLAETMFADEEYPRPSLWDDIAKRLPANDASADDTRSAPSERASVRRWQVASAACAVLALGLGLHAMRPMAPPPRPAQPPAPIASPTSPFVAVLRGDDGRAAIAVTFDRAANRLTILPSSVRAAQGSIELWVIGADGKPHSLGLVSADHSQWRPANPGLVPVLAPGSTIAVTREAAGGSATGQPTSTPFLVGTLAPI